MNISGRIVPRNLTIIMIMLPELNQTECSGPLIWTQARQHDDVIKWKHFPRYWPFVRGIHRSPVNSPHKGQ